MILKPFASAVVTIGIGFLIGFTPLLAVIFFLALIVLYLPELANQRRSETGPMEPSETDTTIPEARAPRR